MTRKKMGNSSRAAAEAVMETACYFSTLVRRKSFVYHASSPVTSTCRRPSGESSGHFLDECCLCRRPLGRFRDIFMYKGDTPFCSEECRQEQIAMDEAKEGKEESCGIRRAGHGVPVRAAARVHSGRSHAAEPAAA